MFDRYAAQTEMSWTRRAIIIASLAAHGIGGIGLFVYSIWHVEEIAPPAVSLTFFSAPPPPPPPPPPAHKKSNTVEKKVTPTQVVQPTTKIVQPQKPEEKKDDKKDDKDDKDDKDGQEGGVAGGVKGGVAGGTVGGVVGGTIGGTGSDLNAKPTSPRMVAGFTLAAQVMSAADPHLTDEFKSAHPQQVVKGMYKICLGTDGHVTDVTPMTSIPGMDTTIISQIRSTWSYKPQALPVCFAKPFAFKIN